jgi:hypothetical protein
MRLILRLYPPAFRDRYGDEIALLLESSPTPRRDLLNVFWHGLLDRAEYAVTLGRRRSPKILGYGAVWLLGAYAAGYLADHMRANIIKLVLADSPIPGLGPDIRQMRLLTALCVGVLAAFAFFLGRRYWRGSPGTVITALALISIVANVVRVDAYVIDSVQVRVDWSWFGWTVGEQALWAAVALLLVVAIRRSSRPGVIAILGVAAVAYCDSALMTALVDWRYSLYGNPLTAYWENIMGASFPVFDGDPVMVQVSGWWPTIATALVVGCTFAARFVPSTAYSEELVS